MNNILRTFLAYSLIISEVYFFRKVHGNAFQFILVTLSVMLFWYLQRMSFVFSSLRNFLILFAVVFVAYIGFQTALPVPHHESKTGLWSSGDLNPALIAKLKQSHEIAYELFFDHKPSTNERYYKVGQLNFSEDGLHYTNKEVSLSPGKVPRTLAWTKTRPENNDLDGYLHKIKIWMQNEFSYSLEPGTISDSTPLDTFLFDKKIGFCEHYAAALTTLLKLKNIRARIAIGFAGGSWNSFYQKLTYEDADAHAWVEVQEPNTHEWKIIDPTLWVQPNENNERTEDINLIFVLILIMLITGILIALLYKPKSVIEKLNIKLTKMESRLKLQHSGFTLSERMTRLAHTKKTKPASAILKTLLLYEKAFYQENPNKRNLSELAKSIKKW